MGVGDEDHAQGEGCSGSGRTLCPAPLTQVPSPLPSSVPSLAALERRVAMWAGAWSDLLTLLTCPGARAMLSGRGESSCR